MVQVNLSYTAGFQRHIRLFEATLDSEVLAGVVIFESAMVAHVQYIAASERGRDVDALDGLFEHLIEQEFRAKPYFDFGISNEQQGRYLQPRLDRAERRIWRAGRCARFLYDRDDVERCSEICHMGVS